MQIDLDTIEKSCNTMWKLVTDLRSLLITARETNSLSLTAAQKGSLKNKFKTTVQNLEAEVDSLLGQVK